MEDGLREYYRLMKKRRDHVLILVLMEDGLRADKARARHREWAERLNPCFNGRWSARAMTLITNPLVTVLS